MSKDQTYRQLIASPRWRALRNAYLTAHPQCEACKAQGVYRAANCVHHLTPVETAPTREQAERLCYQESNLQALCIPCHAAIHKAQRSHSREVHRQREQERHERWKAEHPAPTASRLPRGVFFRDPPRLPNPLALSFVDGASLKNPISPAPSLTRPLTNAPRNNESTT
ncbi:MAG: HNH endonuclease signature motif containing protein [Paludibacteraceae bacterium]